MYVYVFTKWLGKPLENMIYENVWGYFLIHFYVMRSAAVSSQGTWPHTNYYKQQN